MRIEKPKAINRKPREVITMGDAIKQENTKSKKKLPKKSSK